MRKIRLLSLTHTYPRFPGDTNGPFVKFLMDELTARGHEVQVLTAWDPELREAPGDSADRPRGEAPLAAYRYAPLDRWHLLGYSRTIEADVRIRSVMLLLAPLMIARGTWRLWRLARRFKPDLIQAHWFLPNGFMASLVSRLTGVPVVATLHGSDVFVAEKGFPYSWMTRFTLRSIALLTSCSPELRDRICELGFPRERSGVVPYAADPAMVDRPADPRATRLLREALCPAGEGPLLFALGRLVYKKGFEYLLRAMPEILCELPGARLVIAGEGDLREKLGALARELGMAERVAFPGRLLRDRIQAHMAACDIFLMPSVRDAAGNIDGLPNVILEAMAAGKPVIASRVAGIPLAVVDGENGRLVPEKDSGAIAAAVLEAAADPRRLAAWGRDSRRRIEEELNWPRIAARYEALLRRVLEERHRGGAGRSSASPPAGEEAQ